MLTPKKYGLYLFRRSSWFQGRPLRPESGLDRRKHRDGGNLVYSRFRLSPKLRRSPTLMPRLVVTSFGIREYGGSSVLLDSVVFLDYGTAGFSIIGYGDHRRSMPRVVGMTEYGDRPQLFFSG